MGEPDLRANRLLSLLPDEDLARLEPHLTTVQSRMRDVIQPAGVPVHFCSFPLDAVLSVIVTDADGSAVEMATVGRAEPHRLCRGWRAFRKHRFERVG